MVTTARLRSILAMTALLAAVTGGPVVAHAPLDVDLAAAEAAARSAPVDPLRLVALAELHRAAGAVDEALADLDRAAALAPALAEVDLFRGRAHLDADRPETALAAFVRFLAAAPGHDLTAFALSLVADALLVLDRPLEAVAALDAAIAAAPHPGPELYVSRAVILADRIGSPCALRRAVAGLDAGRERLGPVAGLERCRADLAERAGRAASDRPCPLAADAAPAWLAATLASAVASPAVATAALGVTAVLTRGPYVQLGGADRAVVRWRTDVATASWVGWGASPGATTWTASDSTATTEHELLLSALDPATTYYYTCGAAPEDVQGGGDADHHFATAPPVGSDGAFRLWVVGDSGTGNADAAAVRDGYLAFSGGVHPDLWLMVGDNAYDSGTDGEYQTAVFDLYPTILRDTFLWPAIGNHDAYTSDSPTQTGPYFAAFTLPTAGEVGGAPSGTEAYYALDWGNLHLVCLDSSDTSLAAGSPMLQWLEADLDGAGQDWTIVFFHHPPYTHGSHSSDNPTDSSGRMFAVRENVLPILEAHGVDLVLAGHSHSYERSFFLDGHYGTSDTLEPATMVRDGGDGRPGGDGAYAKVDAAHDGAVYVVAGSSGKISGGPLDHPVMFVSLNQLGSLVVDTTTDTLAATFVATNGTAADWFTITKPHVAADFRFADALTSSRVGAPPLTAPGGVTYEWATFGSDVDCRVARLAAGTGLRLDTAWLAPDLRSDYSVVLLVALDAVDARRKLVDCADRLSDAGLYVIDADLVLDGGTTSGPGATVIAAAFAQVALTRAADGSVAGYVDGVLAWSGNDAGTAAISAADVLHLLVDDTVTGSESASGAVARVRLFDRALSAAEVAALDRTAPGQCRTGLVFADGFEAGDDASWSTVAP